MPARRSHNRELWVGVFVILGIASGLLALFSLTDAGMFRGRFVVLTVVPDAGGIRRGDPVQMRGVNIGRIIRFEIGVHQGVDLSLEIDSKYPIPTDSRVELRSKGILGGMVANVIPGSAKTTAEWGDTLAGVSPRGMLDQAGELQHEVTATLTRVQQLLDEETVSNVHDSSQDLRRLLGEVAESVDVQRVQLEAMSGSLRRSAEQVERTVTAPEIDATLERMEQLATGLAAAADVLGRTVTSADSILGRVDRGEGTLGLLARDERLYQEVSDAAASMRLMAEEFARLAADIRKNPKRYVQVSVF